MAIIIGSVYKCVQIGTQIWTERNLDVSTYRNGDLIPEVTDTTEWANLTTGAWCWWDNNEASGSVYGKMYNWYAVNDTRGLAPAGYHVPTDTEWTTLTDYLGGLSVAGGKMKEVGTEHWESPNLYATNSSGFTGYGGGFREYDGYFSQLQITGVWWTSTQYDSSFAWYNYLYHTYNEVQRDNYYKTRGLSVRLVKG